MEKKFYGIYTKYTVGYTLSNPKVGLLSQPASIEGPEYKLHERIERLVQEFCQRTHISI